MGISLSNKDVLQYAYEIWDESRGKIPEFWLELMDENVDFRSLADGKGAWEYARRLDGREEVRAYLKDLVERMEMLHYTMRHFVAEGDEVVAYGRTAWRSRDTGKEVDTPKVDIVRFNRGKIVAFYEFYDTAQVSAILQPD